ncbi:MAG: methyltransferase domain-containing protein [Candidatus Lindowbacteria bacterium]|nr:methyltransferase domain-containing protein [Candidatus Lindowbacteria bacterium]
MERTELEYVHGYSEREHERLVDQATTLTELLHNDTRYPPGCSVLEAGCGVGAQTVTLLRNSPGAHFTSIDLSRESLAAAKAKTEAAGYRNIVFQPADIFNLPFPDESFDHVFVCFVLEHLKNPVDALLRLKTKLKKEGSITVIEGDHGSTYFHPDSREARQTIQCLIDIQAGMGGNSLIGRQLFPLLTDAGFVNVSVSPRMVYVDSSKPGYVEGFTKNTFIAMVEGVREQAIKSRMITQNAWERGIKDLYRTTEPDGTFSYTFFKAIAFR